MSERSNKFIHDLHLLSGNPETYQKVVDIATIGYNKQALDQGTRDQLSAYFARFLPADPPSSQFGSQGNVQMNGMGQNGIPGFPQGQMNGMGQGIQGQFGMGAPAFVNQIGGSAATTKDTKMHSYQDFMNMIQGGQKVCSATMASGDRKGTICCAKVTDKSYNPSLAVDKQVCSKHGDKKKSAAPQISNTHVGFGNFGGIPGQGMGGVPGQMATPLSQQYGQFGQGIPGQGIPALSQPGIPAQGPQQGIPQGIPGLSQFGQGIPSQGPPQGIQGIPPQGGVPPGIPHQGGVPPGIQGIPPQFGQGPQQGIPQGIPGQGIPQGIPGQGIPQGIPGLSQFGQGIPAQGPPQFGQGIPAQGIPGLSQPGIPQGIPGLGQAPSQGIPAQGPPQGIPGFGQLSQGQDQKNPFVFQSSQQFPLTQPDLSQQGPGLNTMKSPGIPLQPSQQALPMKPPSPVYTAPPFPSQLGQAFPPQAGQIGQQAFPPQAGQLGQQAFPPQAGQTEQLRQPEQQPDISNINSQFSTMSLQQHSDTQVNTQPHEFYMRPLGDDEYFFSTDPSAKGLVLKKQDDKFVCIGEIKQEVMNNNSQLPPNFPSIVGLQLSPQQESWLFANGIEKKLIDLIDSTSDNSTNEA